MKGKTMIMIFMAALALLLIASSVSATIALDSVSTDPAVIAAGDEVLVSVNFHDTGTENYDKVNRGEYRLETELLPGDTASAKYVTVLDGNAERSVGHLFNTWTKTYRIKVANGAPVGTYQFKMRFQYTKNGKPVEGEQLAYFTVSVTKQGIILGLGNIVTEPAEIRPGDDYVTLTTYLQNSGRKDAKTVEFTLDMPQGFSAPYSSNNRVWAGYLAASGQQAVITHFNVEDDVTPGVYNFTAHFRYTDLDDNTHEQSVTFPVRVREKPVLVVTSSEGSLLAGGKGELRVVVQNIGTERAEAVDVRLIKQSSQPFSFDARSDFLGTIAPGGNATAVFTLSADRDAALKTHSFTALIRARGDSDKGDNRVYTFSRDASVDVTGKRPNYLLWLGIVLVVVSLLGIGINAMGKRRR